MGYRTLLVVGKIVGVTLAVMALIVCFIWYFFTFTRIEWVYGESWGGELQKLQDERLGIRAFRFNDYGSTDGTYALVLVGERDCLMKGAKARAVRRSRQHDILYKNEFHINKTPYDAFLLTLAPEFAPCDEDEMLEIEIVCHSPHDERTETILLKFKSKAVRHFKSI